MNTDHFLCLIAEGRRFVNLTHIDRQVLGIDRESAGRALELPPSSVCPVFLGGPYAHSSGRFSTLATSTPQVKLEEQAHAREVRWRARVVAAALSPSAVADALSPSAVADVGLLARTFAERLSPKKVAAPTPPPPPSLLPTWAAVTVAGGAGAAFSIVGAPETVASGSGVAATIAGAPTPGPVRGGKKAIQLKGQRTLPPSWFPPSSATSSPASKKNRM